MVRKSSMPASRHRSRSPSSAEAVIAMIGTRSPACSWSRIARVAAKPSIRGIRQSIRTAAYPWPGLSASTASTPSAATSASYPPLASIPTATIWLTWLSSTTSTRSRSRTGRAYGVGGTQPLGHLIPQGGGEPRGEPERAATSLLALHGDPAAHGTDQFLGDGEPESGAAVTTRGRRVGLGEGVEEPLLGVARRCPPRCRRRRPAARCGGRRAPAPTPRSGSGRRR